MSAAAAALAASLLLADLPDDAVARLREIPDGEPASRILSQVREVAGAYRFDAGTFVVETDKRWWGATPERSEGAALLEMRRWPGDTVIALYAVAEAPLPPVPGSAWSPIAAPAGERRFAGSLPTVEGERPAVWCERIVEGSPSRIAALMIPGDGGLGSEGAAASRAALWDVWDRIEVRPPAWASVAAIPAGAALALPSAGPPPQDGDERSDPWLTVAGSGFSLGLPPGLRARRTDGGVPPPRDVEGGVLWVRGRFTDRRGDAVAVGDGFRSGYLAIVETADNGWLGGSKLPRGLPGGQRVDGLPLDEVVVAETGARAGRVERWREPGWGGSWLVFRLAFGGGRGVEIGLPVAGEWRSLALFWIPATFRPAGLPPAPPPIDAAERLGIKFERLRGGERLRSPLTEGWLVAPGLRIELPRGWYPVVSIRAADGYPITFHDASGAIAGTLRRLTSAEAEATLAATGGGWSSLERPGIHRAAAAHARTDGARLFVAKEGHAFLLEPSGSGDPASLAGWARLTGSPALSRTKDAR